MGSARARALEKKFPEKAVIIIMGVPYAQSGVSSGRARQNALAFVPREGNCCLLFYTTSTQNNSSRISLHGRNPSPIHLTYRISVST